MNDVYQEVLSMGETLVIEKNKWYVKFHYQGPDTRYGLKEFIIAQNEIDEYITALKENFDEYLNTRKNQALTQKKGKKEMYIRYGLRGGVCLYQHYYLIRTQKECKQLIRDLEYARNKAKELKDYDI